MKLEKAIEISEDILRNVKPGDPPDEHDSLKLLIEAGKRIMRIRKGSLKYCRSLLPDEKPDRGS